MTSEFLTDFQRRKLLHKFNLLDIDQNGVIEYKDFHHVIEQLAEARGYGEDDPRYQRLLGSNQGLWIALQNFCDVDEDGEITTDEWLNYHAAALYRAHEFDHLVPGFETTLGAFTAFLRELLDSDGDGVVTRDDYLELSRAHNIDDTEAEATFKAIDRNGDGRLTLDEVSTLVRDFYLCDDPSAPGNSFFGKF